MYPGPPDLAPAERLAQASDRARTALDDGGGDAAHAARQLARLARTLLRAHPRDPDLAASVQRLSSRDFDPPHPASLPPGSPLAVWTALSARQPADLEELAASIVALPDAATHSDEAARLVELLVEVPSEHDRAARSIEALAPHRPAGEIALWRFRLAAAQQHGDDRADEHTWDDLLTPLRALRDEAPDALAAALHLAASAVASERHAFGAEWLVPTLGGRRLLNAAAAAHRRPELADELTAVFAWLEEAARLPVADNQDPLGWSLRLMSSADTAGRFADGTAALVDALDSDRRTDLARALAVRAEIFQAPALGVRAAAAGHPVVLTAPDGPPGLPIVSIPAPPAAGWSDAVLQHGSADSGTPTDPETLAFLEAAGATVRAASGWLALATTGDESSEAQLQAWRLRASLSEEQRAQLATALAARVPDDELELQADAEARRDGACLLEILPAGLDRDALLLRLRVCSSGDAAVDIADIDQVSAPATTAADDPHSAVNRLAACADLLDEGRPDAAAAVLTSLIKRLDDLAALPQLIALSAGLLQLDAPPSDLLTAVARALERGGPVGDAVLDRLASDPLAAYSLHVELHLGGLDRNRDDALRTRMLATWLGIWRATGTPPDPGNLHEPMHKDPALLALAAAQLSGAADPVSAAAAFLTEHPPLRTVPHVYGEALLALSSSGTDQSR